MFPVDQPRNGRELSHPPTSPTKEILEDTISQSASGDLLFIEASNVTPTKRARPFVPIPKRVAHTSSSPATMEALNDSFASKPSPKKQRISFKEPQPIVAITVGKEEIKRTFIIYSVFLCRCSPVFRRLLADNRTSIRLERFPPHIFGLFVHWLYHQEVYDAASDDHFPGYIVLMDLWALGLYLDVLELRNAVLDVMVSRETKVKVLPDHVLMHLAWETVPHDSNFMRMLVDWFVLRVQIDYVGEILEKFPKGLVEKIAVAAMLSPIRGSANMQGLIRRPATYYHEKSIGK